MNNETENRVESRHSDGKAGQMAGSAVLAVLFAPVLVVASIVFFVFMRLLKWRTHITAIVTTVIVIILALIGNVLNIGSGLLLFGKDWGKFLGSYIYICIIFGFILGNIYTSFKGRQLLLYPELKHMKGWAYKFTYKETPLQRYREKKVKESLQRGDEYDTARAPIGILDEPQIIPDEIDERTKQKIHDMTASAIIYRYYTEARAHTLITGATGSGKTITMLNLIYNDVLSGNPICLIDFKKSPDLIWALSKWATENDREFYHFIGGKTGLYTNEYGNFQATYDPLSTGSPTAKADMILNMRTWDTASEVFKKRTQDILQSMFYLLDRTDPAKVPGIEWDKGGLAQFVSALDLKNLMAMIEVMEEDYQRGLLSPGDVRRLSSLSELYNEISGKRNTGLKDQINELISIARTLIVSNYGDWLASDGEHKHINLFDIATSDKGPIVLFSFNPQEESDFAKYIGSIVMSDLSRVSAMKNAQGNKELFGVYIDEFQTLDPDSVRDNLEKARSANFYITLSLQSLDQIVKAASGDGEATLNALLDTVNNFIFHDGSGHDTAEKMSKIIGKGNKYVYRATSRMPSGLFGFNSLNNKKAVVNKDTVNDWLVPPSEFQKLMTPKASNGYKATAYVINKSIDDTRFERYGGAVARKVQVVVNDEIVSGVPQSFLDSIKPIMESSGADIDRERIQREDAYKASLLEDEDDWIITSNDGDVDLKAEAPVSNSLPSLQSTQDDTDLFSTIETTNGEVSKEEVSKPEGLPKPAAGLPKLGAPRVNELRKEERLLKQPVTTSFDEFKKKGRGAKAKGMGAQSKREKTSVDTKEDKKASNEISLPSLEDL